MQDVLSAFAGFLAGALLAGLLLVRQLHGTRATAARLARELAEAGAARATLADLRAHLSGLRHDIRGILSPAMLVSDRLLTHAEPGVRRAGEVMVRVVERAIARLAETRLDDGRPDTSMSSDKREQLDVRTPT